MPTILSTGVTTLVDTAIASQTQIGTGATTFIPIVTQRGPTTPQILSSIATYEATYGGRHSGYAPSYDAVEALTAGSGANARVACVRVVGPAAKAATLDLQESGSAKAVTLTATSKGTWGNAIHAEVATVAGSQVIRIYDGDRLAHQWPASTADALAESAATSSLITVTVAEGKGASKLKDVAKTPLAGGKDDDNNIRLEHVTEALNQFDKSWGQGHVIAPMWATTEAHRALLTWASETNRVALLDAPKADKVDTAKITEWGNLRKQVAQHFVDGQDMAWRGALFPMWITLRPWGRGVGIERAVPGSVFAAAVIANNARNLTPNEMPIETNGYPAGAIFTAPVVPMSEVRRDEVATLARVNLPHADYNGLRLYGFTSVSDSPAWEQFNRARFASVLTAQVADRTRFIIGKLDNEASRVKLKDMIAAVIGEHIAKGNLTPLTPDEPFKLTLGTDPVQPSRVTASVEVRFANAIQAVVITVLNATQ